MSVFEDNNNHGHSNGHSNGKAKDSDFSLASIGIENLFATTVQHGNTDLLYQSVTTLLDSNIVPTRTMFNLMTKTILSGAELMPTTMHAIMQRILNITVSDTSLGWRPAAGKPEDWKFLLQFIEAIKPQSELTDGPVLLLKDLLATLDQLEAHGVKKQEHQLYLLLDNSGETHTSTIAKLFSTISFLIEKTTSPLRQMCIRFVEHILLAFLRTKYHDAVYSRFFELFNSFKNNSYRILILRTLKYSKIILEVTTHILARNFDAGLFEEYTSTRGSSTRPTKRARTETDEVDRSFAPSSSLLHRFVLQDLLYRPFSKGRTPKASPLMLVALLNHLFLAVLAEEPNKADLLRDDFLMSQLHENMRELKNAIDAFTTKDSKEAKLQIHGFMTSLHDMIEYETRTRYNK